MKSRVLSCITLLTAVLFTFVFSACVKQLNPPDENNKTISTTATSSPILTQKQIKLVETMRKRANSGTTITATQDVLTITEMNNKNKMDTVYYLLNLGDNDNMEIPLKNAGFRQMKFIRRFEGRTQVNNYQLDLSKPMTDKAIEYIN